MRGIFALVLTCSLACVHAASLDTVEVIPTVNKSYESDPTNGYGVLTFTRTGSSGDLYVEFEITVGNGYATPPANDTGTTAISSYRRDYILLQDSDGDGAFGPVNDSDEIEVLNTTTLSYASALLPFPSTVPIRGVALIRNGRLSTQVRVVAESELPDTPADWPRPELGELVKVDLLAANTTGFNYLPVGAQLSVRPGYVRGARNSATVGIVDRHTRAESQARDAMALETNNATRAERSGIIRAWFVRSDTSGSAAHPYYSDVNGKGRRLLEMALAGTATVGTDYVATYKIGGGVTFEGGNSLDPYERVVNGFAYRATDEYGVTMLRNVDDDGARDQEVMYSSAIFRQFNGPNFQMIVTGGTTLPTTAIPGTVLLTAISGVPLVPARGISFGTTADGTSIDIISGGALNLDVLNEATLTIQYDEFIAVGNPAVLVQVTRTLPGWAVSEPIMYPVGSTAVSVLDGQRLFVGDVFEFSNDPGVRYRITGPTPSRLESPAHPSGNDPVNLDANGNAVAAAGAPYAGFISFYPPLKTEIRRPEVVRIVTEFSATFAGARETINIPQLPVPPTAPYQNPALPLYPILSQYTDNIPNGDWVEFLITPVDDAEVEGAEDVQMTLVASSDYDIGQPQTSRVVIGDNDVLANITTVSNAGEPSSAGVFRVTFSQAFTKDVEIPFQFTTDGLSAPITVTGASKDATIQGLDLTTLRGSVIMPAGQTTFDIAVTPVSDSLVEGTEQVKLLLLDSSDYQLQGSASGSLNPTAATMNLLDAVSSVSVSAAVSTVTENPVTAAVGIFTFSRSGGLSAPVQITYTVSSGIGYATAAADYTALSGSVTIPAGASSIDVPVTVIDDRVVEKPESVTVTIQSQPGYAIASGQNEASIQILDDEPTISIVRVQDATEKGTIGKFRVSYPGVPAGTALNRPVSVRYATAGTATPTIDYAALSGIVVIPANSLSVELSVAALEDTIIDPSETVTVTLSPVTTADEYQLSTSSTATTAQLQILDKTQVVDNGVIGSGDNAGGGCGSGAGTAALMSFLTLGLLPTLRRRRRNH